LRLKSHLESMDGKESGRKKNEKKDQKKEHWGELLLMDDQ